MHNCYLGLGSNLKNPERQLIQAIKKLRQHPCIQVIKISSFYASKASGRKMQPDYLNAVLHLRTRLSPYKLLNELLALEKKQQRVRKSPGCARTLDLDLLVYEQKKINHPRLKLPHPRLQDRDFVLYPLQEITSCFFLIENKSLAELMQNLRQHHIHF